MNKNVVTFGDSILFGIVVNPDNMRYLKPKEYDLKALGETLGVNLTNLSKMGRDSRDGLFVVKNQLQLNGAPDVAIVEYGGNDCTYNWSELSENPEQSNGHPKVELSEYIRNLTEITRLLQSAGTTVYYMNLPPISGEKHLEWITKDGLNKDNLLSFLGTADTIRRVHAEYNSEFEGLARKLHVPILDVRSKFMSKNNFHEIMSLDGVHPSRSGLNIIKDEIHSFLEKIS